MNVNAVSSQPLAAAILPDTTTPTVPAPGITEPAAPPTNAAGAAAAAAGWVWELELVESWVWSAAVALAAGRTGKPESPRR